MIKIIQVQHEMGAVIQHTSSQHVAYKSSYVLLIQVAVEQNWLLISLLLQFDVFELTIQASYITICHVYVTEVYFDI